MRTSYEGGQLAESDLAATPGEQFARWLSEAVASAITEPNAMTLATVDAHGVPSARTVLLKGADQRGFCFYTNLTSRKGRALAETGRAALVLPWVSLQRQVSVIGVAEQVPREETAEYFRSRPWASRIGAWASHQSQVVGGRDGLEQRFAELSQRWPDTGSPEDVPVPDHWGGWVVRPLEVEFWQGRVGRLHDRLVYVSTRGTAENPKPAAMDETGDWAVIRRNP